MLYRICIKLCFECIVILQQQQLTSLLQGTWKDPDTGICAELPIRDIVIEENLVGRGQELFAALGVKGRLLLVADKNTYDVLGDFLSRELRAVYDLEEYIFSIPPKATDESVALVQEKVVAVDCVVAVGSGTINDICKYASFLENKPYIIWGTAPSMNGYASSNAAITMNGHKRSLLCCAPLAIYMDLDMLAEAPVRLIRSGVGDALCRSTAQIDWLLSHLVLGTPYKKAPFVLLEGDESFFLKAGELLVKGDRKAVKRLVYNLILSGIGMMLCGGSYPASQGEHLIAHAFDMKYPDRARDYMHGEMVGITTLSMALKQQDIIFSGQVPSLLQLEKSQVYEFWGKALGGVCWDEYNSKITDGLESSIRDRWDRVLPDLRSLIVDYNDLKAILMSINALYSSADIGLEAGIYSDIVQFAPSIRDRFTFLDIML